MAVCYIRTMANGRVFTTAFVAVLGLGLSASAATIEAEPGRVAVKLVTGQSVVLGESDTLPYRVSDGTRVETASESRARILLDDESEINLASGTELLIDAPTGERRGSAAFELLGGTLRALVKKRPEGMERWRMKVNNAVMGVRGTEFLVEANRDHARLCAFDGVVDIELAGEGAGRRTLRGGQGVLVSSEGKISPPVTMEPKILDYWRQQTLVDRSDSPRTRLRALERRGIGSGPDCGQYLDPSAAYSAFQMLNFGGTVWGRGVKTENVSTLGRGVVKPDLSATGRFGLNAAVVPTVRAIISYSPREVSA